jgi:hypothetical protein
MVARNSYSCSLQFSCGGGSKDRKKAEAKSPGCPTTTAAKTNLSKVENSESSFQKMNLFDQLNEGPVTEVDIPAEFDSRDIAGWLWRMPIVLKKEYITGKNEINEA